MVDRHHGPNVTKDRVSAAVINGLFACIGPDDNPAFAVRNKDSDDTDFSVRDLVVWPHEDSVPERMAMQPRETVDRVPETKPVDTPV